MNGQRVGAAVAWVAVVVVGAGASWYAIDRAGGEVSPGASVAMVPSASAEVDQQPPSGGTPAVPRPTATSTPRTAPGTVVPPAPRPSTTAPRPTASGQTGATTQRRTWSGAAGLVTATCTGTRLRFESAQPADGWQVKRSDDETVDVRFERGEQEVRVTARCVGGVPAFSVRTDDD